MNSSSIERHLPAAKEALASFLATLLGGEAPVSVDPPASTTLDAAETEHRDHLVIVCKTVAGFAVTLQPEWLPLLSKSMLGEAISVGDPGYEDLTCELAGQAAGAIRTQLAASGLTIPEMLFEVVPSGESLPAGLLPDSLWQPARGPRADRQGRARRGLRVALCG